MDPIRGNNYIITDSNKHCIRCQNEVYYNSLFHPVTIVKILCSTDKGFLPYKIQYAVNCSSVSYTYIGCSDHLPLMQYIGEHTQAPFPIVCHAQDPDAENRRRCLLPQHQAA
jgi:hypothetical protein